MDFRQILNLSFIRAIDTLKYPDLTEVSKRISSWDGRCDITSITGSFFSVFGSFVIEYLNKNYAANENYLPESVLIEGLRYSRDFLLKNYGTLDVELGQLQKVAKGSKEMPMYGGLETLASCTVKEKNGKMYMHIGDTFIMYAKYGSNGLEELKTNNNCGNSSDPENPHYDDQMELFVNKTPRVITMDKIKIYKNAVSVTHPQ